VIEFALEYRTNRDKILQMRKRLAEKRERNKTRGMMIGMAQGGAPQAALGRHRTSVGGVDKEVFVSPSCITPKMTISATPRNVSNAHRQCRC
jgi:hypothetical protein